jgi:signal transduction histidine kinase/ActR/RegA family two-component response regulator/HAMP domain-containing protein
MNRRPDRPEILLRNLSIKQKLTLLAMASSTLALLLVSAGFFAYELATFRKTMTDDLSTTAQIIGSQNSGFLTLGGTDKDIWNGLRDSPHIMAACLYKGTNIAAAPYFRDKNVTRLVPLHPGPPGWRFDFGQNQLQGFQPIRWNGETIGVVYLKSDLDALYSRFYHYLGIIVLFMLASSAVVYLFSLQLRRIITRPVFHLAQTAKTITAGKDYSLRAEKESDDELGQLMDGFNEMLEQIQRRDAALHSVNAELEKARGELELRVQERTRELQRQLAHISLLNQITYAVGARYDFDSIILVLLQQLEEHLPVDYGCVYRFDAETELLRAMVLGPKSRPIAEQLKMPATVPLDETPFRSCLAGKIIYEPDYRQSDAAFARTMASVGLLSSVTAPLMVEDRMFGLLTLLRRQADGFSHAELDFIRGLSAHVALAVRQAQLYHDLQKAYNELRQTQQTVMQQERLKALGQMASGIAHDINNALSPIVGFADLVNTREAGLSENSRRHLRHIRTAGEDIAHIVSRLRDFYRSRDEEEPLLPLNLDKVIEQVIDMTRPRWRTLPQNHGITIQMQKELEPDLPALVGIESEIREVLTNLIINAVDALPAGGVITVRTRLAKNLKIGKKSAAASHIVLEISDTGIGMDEETRSRCLEPFFSTKGHRGTGLGLSMVYGVVERHDGKIEIDSELGKGTTMRLIFPVRKVRPAEVMEFFRDEKMKSLRVLCVDDDPLLRELVKEILERDGHTVETADSGEAGVAAFRKASQNHGPFDVVLTDLGMPYMDGREVAKIIKLESPETPVVMLTGWGAFVKESAAAPSDFDGVLGKPPRLRELREMFRRVISRSSRGRKEASPAQGA